jgi:hypothetical protein
MILCIPVPHFNSKAVMVLCCTPHQHRCFALHCLYNLTTRPPKRPILALGRLQATKCCRKLLILHVAHIQPKSHAAQSAKLQGLCCLRSNLRSQPAVC